MAGFKETPRQKMIGMMYLVLTALLALNVSKEILDAFVIVNDSVEKTSANFTSKVEDMHGQFSAQYQMNPDKTRAFYEKSVVVKNKSQQLINYMDSLKFAMIAKTEGIPFDSARVRPLSRIDAKDNYDVPTNFLLGSEGLKMGHGYKLRDKINEYREALLQVIPEQDREALNFGLRTDEGYRNATGQSQDWVEYNFYHTILAADVTIFNKLVNEVRNAEYDVTNYLFQGISKSDFKFSSIEPRVMPTSRFIFQGDTYEAEVFMAAVDETAEPTVMYQMNASDWDNSFASSAKIIQGDSGVVKLEIPTSGMAPKEYTFAGQIGVMKPDGTMKYESFKSSFIVAEPSANVSATKMNVFYRGVDNPVNISASGVPATQLRYEIIGDGRIQESGKGLVVNNLTQSSVGNVKIRVYSEFDGDRKQLGEQEFRVKDLPPPNIMVRDMAAGVVSKDKLLANPYLLCELPEYVNFEYKYQVTRFVMGYTKGGDYFEKKSDNAYLTEEMKTYIKEARKNTMIVFSSIEVQGPIKKMAVPNFAIKIN